MRAQYGDHLPRLKALAGKRVPLLLCGQGLCWQPVPTDGIRFSSEGGSLCSEQPQGLTGNPAILPPRTGSMGNSRRVWEHGVSAADRDAHDGAAGHTDSVRSSELYHVRP